MTKRPRDNAVGPWAKEKLTALRQYLDFYTKVLKNQGHWCRGTFYVDAFAGPGLSPIRKQEQDGERSGLFGEAAQPFDEAEIEYVKGSPRVALEVTNPFSRYLFIERDGKRIRDLQALAEEFGQTRDITVRQGDANAELKRFLNQNIDWRWYRGVVFLDPFGMNLPWSTIEAVGRTGGLEVIINFPLHMAIQRMMTSSGDMPRTWQLSLDEYFGSPDWRPLVYEERHDLFGVQTLKSQQSGERLLEWYQARLKSIFGHVSAARLIRNTRGTPLYYLIWAGPNATGLKGANYILRGDRRVAKAQQVIANLT